MSRRFAFLGQLNELWDSDATRLKKLRDKLQAMTDQQLLDYGRDCGEMCADKYMRVSFEPDPWLVKLREARSEENLAALHVGMTGL
jgi:hypothetical protein